MEKVLQKALHGWEWETWACKHLKREGTLLLKTNKAPGRNLISAETLKPSRYLYLGIIWSYIKCVRAFWTTEHGEKTTRRRWWSQESSATVLWNYLIHITYQLDSSKYNPWKSESIQMKKYYQTRLKGLKETLSRLLMSGMGNAETPLQYYVVWAIVRHSTLL